MLVQPLHLNSDTSYFFSMGVANKLYMLLGKTSPISSLALKTTIFKLLNIQTHNFPTQYFYICFLNQCPKGTRIFQA